MSSNLRPRLAVFLGIAIVVLVTALIWGGIVPTPFLPSDSEAKLTSPPDAGIRGQRELPSALPSGSDPKGADRTLTDTLREEPGSAVETFIKIGSTRNDQGGKDASDASTVASTDESGSEASVAGEKDVEQLLDQESFWLNRLTYPTGRFNPVWLRRAAEQDSALQRSVPDGRQVERDRSQSSPFALDPNSFTPLGPKPEHMTGCAGCFDYGITQGRVNAIVVDPTTTTTGSIVAYIANIGGGIAKTTNCCSAATTWDLITDDPLITTTGVDTLAIDPNDHNVVYAGTGDLNFGSFSMGSQGVLKTTDAGATWSVLGADVFGAAYIEPAGQFPQYDAIGKVRVDPNNSNRVVAGTKKGLFISYNGGVDWTGPCTTNSFSTQRQDTTGLELSNMGGGVTRILAAIGTRGFATPVQYDLGNQGANGLYKGTLPSSGCPGDFTLLTRNDNGLYLWHGGIGQPVRHRCPDECRNGSPLFQLDHRKPAQPHGHCRGSGEPELHLYSGRIDRGQWFGRLRRRLRLPAWHLVKY